MPTVGLLPSARSGGDPDGLQRRCLDLLQVELLVQVLVQLPDDRPELMIKISSAQYDLHVVSAHDVQPERDLADAGRRAEHPLVRLLQHDVDGLVEALKEWKLGKAGLNMSIGKV